MNKKLLFNSLIVLITIFGFTGCGGGASTSNSSTSSTTTDTLNSGILIDSPIKGIKYITETQVGYTDENGTYYYKIGETVEFIMGNLSLGKVVAQDIITPYTLSGDTDMYNPSTKTANIARLLQSLDDDLTDEIITIPEVLHDLDISYVDLTDESDTPFLEILDKAAIKTSKTYTLKTKELAVNIMINYLVENNITVSTKESDSSDSLPTTLEELQGNNYYVVMDRMLDNNGLDPDSPEYPEDIKLTYDPLTIAIDGTGFFALQMPDGSISYTRNGIFKLNAEGTIVNENGYPLVPQIVIPNNVIDLTIGYDGVVIATEPTSQSSVEIGQIELFTFPNSLGLLQTEKNMFIPTVVSGEAIEGQPATNNFGRLLQGMLELDYYPNEVYYSPNGIIKGTTLFDNYRGKRLTSGIFGTVSENYIINSSTAGYLTYDSDSLQILNSSIITSVLNMEIYQITSDYTELHIKDYNGDLVRKEYLFIDNQKRDVFYNNMFYKSNEITHNGFTYRTVTSPTTGRIWLDRNLGASQVCSSIDDEACFGDYYQWGRNTDGHEKKNSLTTNEISTTLTPSHSSFIISTNEDWTYSDYNGAIRYSNWNPCPTNFRVPTIIELLDESIQNNNDAFEKLKFPVSGGRNEDGTFYMASEFGKFGDIWSINPTMTNYSSYFYYHNTSAGESYHPRIRGRAVRCIKDNQITTYLDNNLIAHYKFDGNTNDSTSNNNTTNLNNVYYYDIGAIGSALGFYNQTDVGDITAFEANFPDNISEEFTLSFFVKVDSSFVNDIPQIQLNSTVSNSDPYFSDYLDILLNGNCCNVNDFLGFGTTGNAWNNIEEMSNLGLTDNFTHIVITHVSNNIFNIYINGSYLTTKTLDNFTLQPIKQIQIQMFSGQIDDLRLYNKGFTSQEVSSLYNSYYSD